MFFILLNEMNIEKLIFILTLYIDLSVFKMLIMNQNVYFP